MSLNIHADRILILDFGSQYTQLIARRVREIGVYCELHAYDMSEADIRAFNPKGIILSGGPETVTVEGTPRAPQVVFELGVPVLGICYGMQTMAMQLGGKVENADHHEYGYAQVRARGHTQLLKDIEDHTSPEGYGLLDVWMSHGDRVCNMPEGFVLMASTDSAPIAAMGDANGKYMFKHVANYESQIVYYNAILKNKTSVDYHAVPHAVFTEPEIASVGLKQSEAIEKYGKDNVLIGFHKYADTAKGEAMALEDEFVKVLLERNTGKILGAHIIGPQASVLIQEIINLMYTSDQSSEPLNNAMHIHPSLSEVVSNAFRSLMTPEQYHHVLHEHMNL